MEIASNKNISKDDKVLLRLDLDVPADESGKVRDDSRLVKQLEFLEELISIGCSIAFVGNRRNPEGKKILRYSLEAVCTHLSKLIGKQIDFVSDPESLFSSQYTMMENARFFSEEQGSYQEKDRFSKRLLSNASVFVYGDFAHSYSDDASVLYTIKNADKVLFSSNFEYELSKIKEFMDKDKLTGPVALILGGVKIRSKVPVIRNYMDVADYFVFGGALANTFLKSGGYEIGNSLHDEQDFELAQEIMLEIEQSGKKVVLPSDVIVCDEVKSGVKTATLPVEDIDFVESIGDIGKITIMKYAQIIQKANTVIFSGPMGAYEESGFEKGTKSILTFLETEAKRGDKVLLGGGDTLNGLSQFGISHDSFDFVSTGGKAMLWVLSGRKLPVVQAHESK